MPGTFMINPTCAVDLMKMVRSSLNSIRNMLLVGGTQSEETRSQIEQLEQLEQLLLDQAARLDAINKVLEEFNYSVAHELFAPLRRISGFTQEIKQRCSGQMDLEGIYRLDAIMESSRQMNELIDALMQLSRLSHVELQPVPVDLSQIASGVADELMFREPQRAVVFAIRPQLCTTGDPALLKTAMCKLLENAWKYTADTEAAVIEFGILEPESEQIFYVRDNGAGFDMSDYGKLFHPFQRLHDPALYPGYGIGLTAVKRIIERHGGRIWAEGAREQGATFYFTIKFVEYG